MHNYIIAYSERVLGFFSLEIAVFYGAAFAGLYALFVLQAGYMLIGI